MDFSGSPSQPPVSQPPEQSQLLGQLAVAVSTSLVQIAICTVVGVFIDRWLEWIFVTPVGVCVGMAIAFRTLLSFLNSIPPSKVSGSKKSGSLEPQGREDQDREDEDA